MGKMSKPHEEPLFDFVLKSLERSIANLLGYCDYPVPNEPLSGEWLDSIRGGLRGDFSVALGALQKFDDTVLIGDIRNESLQQQLRETQSRCLKLATLLHDNPALSTVKFDEWKSPQRRRLVESIAEMKDKLARIVSQLDEQQVRDKVKRLEVMSTPPIEVEAIRAEPGIVDVIETFWCNVRQLQIYLRAEQSKLYLPRPEYVSQKANELRDNFRAARKVFDKWRTEFARLHTAPIKFYSETSTSYAGLIFDLTFMCFKFLESRRLGHEQPQFSIVMTNFAPYDFSANDVETLRQWFDTQEVFRFTGSRDEQHAQIHKRLPELLIGFRQECARLGLSSDANIDPKNEDGATKGGTSLATAVANHEDGPEDPHWLWFNNKRHKIGTSRKKLSYALLKFFWNRSSATFEELIGHGKPWKDAVTDNAFAVAATRFNSEMPRGFPWRLKTDGRCLLKELLTIT